MSRPAAIRPVARFRDGTVHTDQDLVAVEAPLTLSIGHAALERARPLGVLMRTPGDDEDLVRGLLVAEGIVRAPADIAALRTTADAAVVDLAAHVDVSRLPAQRTLDGTSACGLCGRVEMLRVSRGGPLSGPDEPAVSAALLATLPDRLRARQTVFAQTGGLHAAATFDCGGAALSAREDVGRHNAVDKLVGAALAAGALPLHRAILVVSGRIAFEIVQKAAAAGVPILVAIGAPTDLAVDAARASGLTLVGFTREGRFNCYAGADRLRPG